MSESKSLEALNQETRDIWDTNAEWWDAKMGEGGVFQKLLIGPTTECLLDIHPGERVLDIACGNGAFARRLAKLGAEVVAFDFSERFLARARARTTEYADRIEYRLVDAADENQLLGLGEGRYDAAVCTMAMMDMPTIQPLLSGLSRLLKEGSRFVFSVQHPCFNSNGVSKLIEEEERHGEVITSYSLRINRYIDSIVEKGLGVIGQPAPQYYFHRPLSVLLDACFRAGFLMDALEEPVFGASAEAERPFGWANFKQIPPVLIVRLRLIPSRARRGRPC